MTFRRFRSSRARFPRRRRTRSEMWMFRDFRVPVTLALVGGAQPTADNPSIHAYRIVGAKALYQQTTIGANRALTAQNYVPPSASGIVFAGGWLSLQYALNSTLASGGFATTVDDIQMLSALAVLPEDRDTSTEIVTPLRFPPLTAGIANAPMTDLEVQDEGTRVLWHRLDHLPFYGANVSGSDPAWKLQRTPTRPPEHVKAKVRIPETHGLYLLTYSWCGMEFAGGDYVNVSYDVFFRYAVHASYAKHV